MQIKLRAYHQLPEPLKPLAKRSYETLLPYYKRVYYSLPGKQTDAEWHAGFVEDFFDSRSEYEDYVTEFEEGPASEIREEGLAEYRKMTGKKRLGAVAEETARDLYALTRTLQPETTVETGVCNGVSTLSVLLALDANDAGTLYSIDYPFRADESLAEFQAEVYKGFGGSAIPSDKDPGWIIPDELTHRWDLTIGKSQRQLPQLLPEVGDVDMFIHDSEHSHPCMMFEYELAYEWLQEDGVLVSDDVHKSDAFDVFTEVREPPWGKQSHRVGFVRKTAADET